MARHPQPNAPLNLDEPSPQDLITGQTAPLDESGSPAARDLQSAETATTQDAAELSNGQNVDSDAINKSENRAGDENWQYNRGGKHNTKVKSRRHSKVGPGILLGLGVFSTLIVIITMTLGAWAALTSYSKYLEQTYYGVSLVNSMRLLKNAAINGDYLARAGVATKTLSQKVANSKLGKMVSATRAKSVAGLQNLGIHIADSVTSSTAGQAVKLIAVKLSDLAHAPPQLFTSATDTAKSFLRNNFGYTLDNAMNIFDSAGSKIGRLTSEGLMVFDNVVGSKAQTVIRQVWSVTNRANNGIMAATRKFNSMRSALVRLGLFRALSTAKTAVKSFATKLAGTATDAASRAAAIRNALTTNAKGVINDFKVSLNAAKNSLVESSAALRSIRNSAKNAANNLRRHKTRLNRAGLASALLQVCVSAYCFLQSLGENNKPDVRYQTVAVPAMNEALELQNQVDTINSGDLSREETDLLTQTAIDKFLYNEVPKEVLVNDADGDDCKGDYSAYEETNDDDETVIHESAQNSDCQTETIVIKSSALDSQLLRADNGQSWQEYQNADIPYSNLDAFKNLQTGDAGGGILQTIGNFLSSASGSAGNLLCSSVGIMIITIVGVAIDAVAAFVSGGGYAAVKSVAVSLLLLGVMSLVANFIPDDENQAGSAIDTEHAEAETVNLIYGYQFLRNEDMINNGGSKLSDEEWTAQNTEYRQWLAAEYDAKPWYEKIFDPTDFRSAISTVARALNLNLTENTVQAGLQNTARVILSLPQIFARIVSPNYSLDAAHAATVYDYNIDHYGYTQKFQSLLLDDNNSYTWDINAEKVITILEEKTSTEEKIATEFNPLNDRLQQCYRKTINPSDWSVQKTDFISSNESNASRYYDDAENAQKFDLICDNENDEEWLRLRIYLLDYQGFVSESCEYDEKQYCDY
jgi:hypothetical protein